MLEKTRRPHRWSIAFVAAALLLPATSARGGDSDCCFANGGQGCADPACQAAVCTIDPFCCETSWDLN